MRKKNFLLWLTGLLLLPDAVSAACGAKNANCLVADSMPPSPHASDLMTLPTRELEAGSFRASLHVSYQRQPLMLVASSSDPFGRRLPLLDHWVIGYSQLAVALLHDWVIAGQLPFSLSPNRTGVSGFRSPSLVVAAGDPKISLMFQRDVGIQLFVLQEVTLPFGSDQSFAHSRSVAYSPSVAFADSIGALTLAGQLGAMLRRSSSYAGSQFASEGQLGLGLIYAWPGTSLGLELDLSPALVRDGGPGGSQRRRIPADWLLSISQRLGAVEVFLGGGSALPLTTSPSEQTVGPPGAALRVQFGVRFVSSLAAGSP